MRTGRIRGSRPRSIPAIANCAASAHARITELELAILVVLRSACERGERLAAEGVFDAMISLGRWESEYRVRRALQRLCKFRRIVRLPDGAHVPLDHGRASVLDRLASARYAS